MQQLSFAHLTIYYCYYKSDKRHAKPPKQLLPTPINQPVQLCVLNQSPQFTSSNPNAARQRPKMNYPTFTMLLLLAFIATAFTAELQLDDMAVRQACPTYCWLGKGEEIDMVIARRCPGGRNKPCERYKSAAKNALGSGRTCDCSTPPTVTPGTPTAPHGVPTEAGSVACNTMVISGSETEIAFEVDVGKLRGSVHLSYQMYTEPDRLLVEYENDVLFDSGSVNGARKVKLDFDGATSVLSVTMFAPADHTAWDFIMSCA